MNDDGPRVKAEGQRTQEKGQIKEFCPFYNISNDGAKPPARSGCNAYASESDFHKSSFDIRPSSFLELSGVQLLTKKSNLLFNRAVLLHSSLDTIDGMHGGGMIAVK